MFHDAFSKILESVDNMTKNGVVAGATVASANGMFSSTILSETGIGNVSWDLIIAILGAVMLVINIIVNLRKLFKGDSEK